MEGNFKRCNVELVPTLGLLGGPSLTDIRITAGREIVYYMFTHVHTGPSSGSIFYKLYNYDFRPETKENLETYSCDMITVCRAIETYKLLMMRIETRFETIALCCQTYIIYHMLGELFRYQSLMVISRPEGPEVEIPKDVSDFLNQYRGSVAEGEVIPNMPKFISVDKR
jgi:hypothetical protein